MKYLNITKSLAVMATFSLIFTACDKAKVATPLGDKGQTLVKIINGGTPAAVAQRPVDFVATPTTILAIELRRDIPSETELNKTMIVTVKDDTAAVRAANPGYLRMPASWFSITADAVKPTVVGGNYTFTFKPGEFSKELYITVPNATLLDPSSLYGFGFTITTADANGKISTQKSVVVEIGAKNNYDGVYAVTGPLVDDLNADLTQWNKPTFADPFPQANGGAWELHLITSGAASCTMFDNTIWGDKFHPLNVVSSGGNSGYGTFALIVNFNPANNAISSVTNFYAPAANTRQAALDPSGVNAVQGNKDILIKYFMLQPSLVPAPPNIRVRFDEKWKYIGPR
jgi:hypothetical protein